MIATLKQANFDCRKWTSNKRSIILIFPREQRERNESTELLQTEHANKAISFVCGPIFYELLFNVSHIATDKCSCFHMKTSAE